MIFVDVSHKIQILGTNTFSALSAIKIALGKFTSTFVENINVFSLGVTFEKLDSATGKFTEHFYAIIIK